MKTSSVLFVLLLVLIHLVLISFLVFVAREIQHQQKNAEPKTLPPCASNKQPTQRALLIYAYFESNKDYKDTLQYLFDVGVRETDPVDYLIVSIRKHIVFSFISTVIV